MLLEGHELVTRVTFVIFEDNNCPELSKNGLLVDMEPMTTLKSIGKLCL